MSSSLEPVLVNDRYRIVRKIGRGGMGAVYEAVDERLNVTVALKECNASEEELRVQFGREARLLASLKHRALPGVFDYFTDGEKAFLTMEFVDGPTLAEVLHGQDGPFAPARVIVWADQLLDVLVYLHGHDRQVIHRDIKPHNLKLTSSGEVVLLDFGLAKSEGDTGCSVHGFTRRYSPLEQIRDEGTSERSDLYALGATLYQLLTGVKPADAEERDELLRQGQADPLRRADELLPVIGKELGGILERAMMLSQLGRFENAIAFRTALQKLGRSNDAEVGGREISYRLASAPVVATMVVMAILVCAGSIVYLGKNVGMAEGPKLTAALNSVAAEKMSGETVGGARREEQRLRPPVRRKPREVKAVRDQEARIDGRERRAIPRKGKLVTEIKASAKKTARLQSGEPRRINVEPKREPVLLRAPNGTKVLRYPDGTLRVFAGGQKSSHSEGGRP